MNDAPAPNRSRQSPLFMPLAGLLLAAGALFFLLAPKHFGYLYVTLDLLLTLSVPTFIAAAILLAALLPGRMLLAALRPGAIGRFDCALLAAGLGLGLLGQLVLLLGLCGFYQRAPMLLLLALLLVLGVREMRGLAQDFRAGIRALRAQSCRLPANCATLLLAIFILFVYLNCFAPDLSFDVLEYHLGAIREYSKHGRIQRIEGNFYSGLPYQAEMLFGIGLLLHGAESNAPQLINFAIFLLTIGAFYSLLRSVTASAAIRLCACLLFASHPLIHKIALTAKSDLALVFYIALSLLCWTHWLREQKTSLLLLSGIFAGLAVSCKLIALGMYVAPALVFLVAWPLCARGAKPDPARIGASVALFGGGALGAFLLWMIKAALFYGNPLFPLFSGTIASPAFSADQYRFYLAAHGAASPFSGAFWHSAYARLDYYLPLFWLPLPALLLLRTEKFPRWPLLGMFVCGHLACNALTHNPDRFQAPLLLLLIAGLAQIFDSLIHAQPRWRFAALIYAVWLAVWANMLIFDALNSGRIQHVFALPGYASRAAMTAKNLGAPVGAAIEFVNSEHMDRNAKILLLYDAQWLLFPQRVTANTVFDRSALMRLIDESGAQSGAELLDWLRRKQYRYLYVNEFELLRLIRFYTPDSVLRAELPNAPAGETLRGEINKHEWSAALLRHPQLYPPLIFETQLPRKIKIFREFLELAAQRQIFESNPATAPRIWIADLQSPNETRN